MVGFSVLFSRSYGRFDPWLSDETEKSIDLSKPLLVQNDGDSAVMGGCGSITNAECNVVMETKRHSGQEEERLLLFSVWDHVCLLIILPLLLVIQFRMALLHENAFTTTTPGAADAMPKSDKALQRTIWTVIGLYVVTAFLYKISLQDSLLLRQSKFWSKSNDDSSSSSSSCRVMVQQFVLLVPEIIMDVVLGLVLCVSAPAAATVLVLATILLSGTVVVLTLHTLWHYHCQYHGNGDDDDSLDENEEMESGSPEDYEWKIVNNLGYCALVE